MSKVYFTFGSDERYPFGREDFVEVEAETFAVACEVFRAYHPSRPGSILINAAGIYTESEFNGFRERFYPSRQPIERIVARREQG